MRCALSLLFRPSPALPQPCLWHFCPGRSPAPWLRSACARTAGPAPAAPRGSGAELLRQLRTAPSSAAFSHRLPGTRLVPGNIPSVTWRLLPRYNPSAPLFSLSVPTRKVSVLTDRGKTCSFKFMFMLKKQYSFFHGFSGNVDITDFTKTSHISLHWWLFSPITLLLMLTAVLLLTVLVKNMSTLHSSSKAIKS